MNIRFSSALLLATLLTSVGAAQGYTEEPQTTPAPRIAIDDDPPGAAVAALDRAGTIGFPVEAHLILSALPPDASLDARLAAFDAHHVPVWLTVPAPAAEAGIEAWQRTVRGIVDKHGSTIAILEIAIDRQPARIAAFAVQIAATDVRASRDAIRIAIGGPAMADAARREEIYRPELAPYVDLLDVTDPNDASMTAWLHRTDSTASLIVSTRSAEAGTDGTRRVVDSTLRDLGTDVTLHAWPASDMSPATFRALRELGDLLTGDITVLDPTGVALALRTGSRDITASLPHRLLFNERTFATYLIYWGTESADPLQMTLVLPVEGVPGVHDVLTAARTRAAGYTREQATGRVEASAPLTGRPMVVDFNEGAADVMMERSSVSAARTLSIDEIIARHLQQQRAQDAIVKSYVAHARMQQHFRPTVADNGMSSSYDILTENRYFVAGNDVEW